MLREGNQIPENYMTTFLKRMKINVMAFSVVCKLLKCIKDGKHKIQKSGYR